MEQISGEQLTSLPKVELHRHLEGSIRLSTVRELAHELKLGLPRDETEFKSAVLVLEPMRDLGSVLNKFLLTQKVLSSAEIIERVAYEACEDAVSEGIRILELRYAPTFVVSGHPALNFQKIHDAVVKGVRRAERTLPIAVGLIAIVQRILDVKTADQVCSFAVDNRDTIVGLDLADNEVGFDSKPFREVFARAKRAGLQITIHAGEAIYSESAKAVRDAIEILGATRIGHGLQIIRDREVMNFVKEKKVVLELCPYSNWLTNSIPDFEHHPFRQLMEAGVLTTINADDPGVMNATLITDYEILNKYHKFTMPEFERCNDTAAAASFIGHTKKQLVWPRPITMI